VKILLGRRFGAEEMSIADVMLKESLTVVAADHRVGQGEVFDDGSQLAFVVAGDVAPDDDGQVVGLPDGTVGIQESLLESPAKARRQAPARLDNAPQTGEDAIPTGQAAAGKEVHASLR